MIFIQTKFFIILINKITGLSENRQEREVDMQLRLIMNRDRLVRTNKEKSKNGGRLDAKGDH